MIVIKLKSELKIRGIIVATKGNDVAYGKRHLADVAYSKWRLATRNTVASVQKRMVVLGEMVLGDLEMFDLSFRQVVI